MKNSAWKASALASLLALAPGSTEADGPSKAPAPPKKVLVELFTSPEGPSTPSPSRLARSGPGADRVVWLTYRIGADLDPFASRRRLVLDERLGPRDLPTSPLIVLDGLELLDASDPVAATAALALADRGAAKVSLDLSLAGDGRRKTLSARIVGRSPAVEGRELLVGVALVEDSLPTRLASGEAAGGAFETRGVVRHFARQPALLTRSVPGRTLTFPVELVDGLEASRARVTAFVEDRRGGQVYQAESIPWPPARDPHPSQVGRTRKRVPPNLVVLPPSPPSVSPDSSSSCSDCGTPYSPEYLASLPTGFPAKYRIYFPELPAPKC